LAVFITFVAINVNSLNRGSAVTIGENAQTGWDQNGKSIYGNSQLIGNNLEAGFLNTVFDNDVIDSPINDIQSVPTAQNQSL